jgi:glutamyl-tRNA synthetase
VLHPRRIHEDPSGSDLMSVVTRFAPSPTGFLHIGGARTALFNWLFSRHHGGRFLLRIEDTDRQRSTQEAIDAIIDGLEWLGLDWDGEPVFQFSRAARHAAVARELLAKGGAYHCYCSPEELAEMREQARKEGRPVRYDGRWRDRDLATAPSGVAPVIRFKAPQTGETILQDLVQGEVRVANDQLDDMVLLRADGTPTYMLSVVVDDRDMEITHVIRGDDHLTNAFRQTQLFLSLGWTPPRYGHIPLIHGADGAKLSKRHGALGVEAYREMGYLSEALSNYLLRLGWAHGNDEIISRAQAIAWFDIDAVGRSPARFDRDKLDSLNAHYMREADDGRLVDLIAPRLGAKLGRPLGETDRSLLQRGMPGLKSRAKTLLQLADNASFYVTKPLVLDDKAKQALNDETRRCLADFRSTLGASFSSSSAWRASDVEDAARKFAEAAGAKLGAVAQPLRVALTGSTVSPPVFEIAEALGRDETLRRIDDVIATGREAAAKPAIPHRNI